MEFETSYHINLNGNGNTKINGNGNTKDSGIGNGNSNDIHHCHTNDHHHNNDHAVYEANQVIVATVNQPKSIKARLQAGDCLYGMSFLSFCPTMVEIAGWSGYDFVILDLEHGFGGISEGLRCIHALTAANTPVIVRVPELSHVWVKKVLDLGPQGIIFPLVDGPQSAKKAVSYCRYPPNGVRGVATPIVRASRFGIDESYAKKYEKDLLILCQVETAEAVENVEGIAAVDGVDGIMVGPLDLSASVGCMHDPRNEKVKEMMRKIESTVLGMKRKEGGGPYLAGFAMPFDGPDQFRSRGYKLIRGVTDVGLFKNACVGDVSKFNMNKKVVNGEY
ncbi:hypothetical protein HN51_062070 [Arachis hypogaea]|uniref:HpcH/HpaI aldolase/citrate lyase domain-containing protein n=1 Tax=Arachis hypogaea TaxID=3818 RepID=A0A445ARA1_ARAHY|nr:uncharacterized protein LOC107604664 [Arachis ipaensis]XP_025627381.1 uncharacterized protein LOC112720605 [Arachis hypogaea]RYR28931.1 hypothetical protein Ahy_B01g053154 [Arachis hypogaea]